MVQGSNLAMAQPSLITGSPSGRAELMIWCLILVFTIVVRISNLGDPDYHLDETFYLLVGNAMHHGAVPYVDIWDRKPPGLFAFYWLLAGISPSVMSFQIAAIGFVAATARIVVQLAKRWSDMTGALLAGGLSIAWLQPLLGGGGQSPVFYNLFIASAILLLVRQTERIENGINHAEALAAATLCGIAVTFKPTAVFEGTFVVIALVALEWKSTLDLRKTGLAFAITALGATLPTLVGACWYIAAGEFHTYFHATIISIFQKSTANPATVIRKAQYLLAITFCLIAGAVLGLREVTKLRPVSTFSKIMLLWFCAAFIGFLAVPNFYSHYALPLVTVLAVCSAPYISKRPIGTVFWIFSITLALQVGQSFSFSQHQRSRQQFERVVQIARANMPSSTLYVFDLSPWLYQATGAPLPSRFVFPEHLTVTSEARAIGVDPIAEINAVLARRPDVIIVAATPRRDVNPVAISALNRVLASNYTFVCEVAGHTFEYPYRSKIFAHSRNPDRSLCPPLAPQSSMPGRAFRNS